MELSLFNKKSHLMINSKFQIIIFILQLLFVSTAFSQNSFFQKSPNRFNYGDSIEWKEPNYNDSSWQILYDDYIESINKFCWIRTNIYLSKDNFNKNELVLLIDLSADYEIYWNGDKFGQNFIGSFEQITKKGIYSESYSFNDSLVFFEKNVLSIRAKLDDKSPLEFAYLNIADPVDIKFSEYKVFGHLFFLMFVYSLLLLILIKYFRKSSSLFLSTYLSITTLIMIISLFIEYLFFAGFVSYEFSFFGAALIKILIYLSLFSISLFFIEFNNVKYGKILFLLIGVILLVCFFLDVEEKYYLTFGLLPPLVIVYYYYENNTFLKLYCFSFFSIIIFFNIAFGLSIMNLFFLIILFYISVIYFNNENLKKNELATAKLRATKLETEMLKKIIQPHYIMNSLNAVIEWIEESPKEGLKFIKELSDEFRSFSTFSNKKSISIREELELCKNHLKIMEYRHHRKYILKTKINDLSKQIPPAIIHTIIENGIAHHPLNFNYINFIIEANSSSDSLELKVITNYVNENNSTSSFSEDSIISNNKENIIEGNGFKYIRSRLSESYGKNWELNYYSNESTWITIIKIFTEE